VLELTLLTISLAVNVGLLLYARWLIKILQAKEEESTAISETIAEYVSHVKSVHDMEMFYGDQTLTSLMEHGRELVLKIEDLDYILYEREEETVDE
tara:strand:+ start:225 stop:512 length:288 start_codon:yes stop_codon:yes gene_type:complete